MLKRTVSVSTHNICKKMKFQLHTFNRSSNLFQDKHQPSQYCRLWCSIAWAGSVLKYIKEKKCKRVIIFLSISFIVFSGCLKEQSHRDGSFEYPQHMFWLRYKEMKFQLRAFNRTPDMFLFGLILYVPSTIFQLDRDGSSWVEPVLG